MKNSIYFFFIPLLLTLDTTLQSDSPSRIKDQFLGSENVDFQIEKKISRVKQSAYSALTLNPNPIINIDSAGRLSNVPVKISSLLAIKDMNILSSLTWAYIFTNNNKFLVKAREYILTWIQVNSPGSNPINNTKLEALITCYCFIKPAFSEEENHLIKKYFNAFVLQTKQNWNSQNNWAAHAIKMAGLSAIASDNSTLLGEVINHYKNFAEKNLMPTGSTYDFHQRDALHYQVYDLEPLLTFALMVFLYTGEDLYNYTTKNGGSIKNSVHFLTPYITREKVHYEFTRTSVKFDLARSKNGEEDFILGKPFNINKAIGVFCLASYFDDEVKQIAETLEATNWQEALAGKYFFSLFPFYLVYNQLTAADNSIKFKGCLQRPIL